MSKVAELQDKQKSLAGEIRTLADEFNANKQEWRDSEQAQKWETINTEYNQVRESLDKERAAESVLKRANEVEEYQKEKRSGFVPGRDDTDSRNTSFGDRDTITDETRSLALQGWMLGAEAEDEHRDAMKRCKIRKGGGLQLGALPTQDIRQLQEVCESVHPNFLRRSLQQEIRNMSIGTPADGGNLVSTTLLSTLEINMLFFGAMRQISETMTTSTGESLAWPTADDTGNTGEIINEAASTGNSVDPTIGKVTWGAHKFSSKVIKISYELIEDSTVNILPIIGAMLGERIGRISNTKFTTGSGSGEPTGIMTAAALGVTAASQTAITADELINLEHSVDIAYRNGALYMMHDNLVSYIRKLKDNDGQYLWQAGLKDGVPDRINGRGLSINNDMTGTLTASDKNIAFGQMSKYKIRRVNDVRFYHLQELYRGTDEDGFIAIVREDGNLLDAGTAPVKYLQQAP